MVTSIRRRSSLGLFVVLTAAACSGPGATATATPRPTPSVGSVSSGSPTLSSPPAGGGSWVLTSSMATPRAALSATVLPNGKVLVAGGVGAADATVLASAELYDPATGTWSPTGSMAAPRAYHTATLLANGKVLVVGGRNSPAGNSIATAELYNPDRGTWSAASPMNFARSSHAAVLLANGKLLVAGGAGPIDPRSSEIYDPISSSWSGVGGMGDARPAGPTATLLTDGTVMLVGGAPTPYMTTSSDVERFDPTRNTLSYLPDHPLTGGRDYATATLLPDRTVIVIGGRSSIGAGGGPLTTTDHWDPTTQAQNCAAGCTSWTLGPPSNVGHCGHTATLLSDGRLLVAGGRCGPTPAMSAGEEGGTAAAEILDWSRQTWTRIPEMSIVRGFAAATLLRGGRVLVVGGFDNQGLAIKTAEIYAPLSS